MTKPYYNKNKIILVHSDTFKFLSKMKPESMDMIFADPPYFLSNGGISNSGGQVVSVDKGDLPLIVTTKRDGDRIQRGKVSKKLSRLFIDEKIPKELRDKLPVIRNKDGVLGVLGINTKVNKNKKYDYYINTKG